jgi:creatinine amidohydrolase
VKRGGTIVAEGIHVSSDLNQPGRQLASLTWSEVAETIDANSIVLLPIGAVEAHGPHLGLDTDVIIAQAAARSAAHQFAAIGREAWIAPPIWYGVSFVGASFAGTTPVGAGPFREYLEWVLRGLAAIGGSDVIVVNAHLEPAHVTAILETSAAVTFETGRVIHAVDHRQGRWAERLGAEFSGGSRHAGSYETSIVMAASPESVRVELLHELEPVWIDLPAQLKAGARTFEDAGGTQAYFGDPAISSAEEGKQLIEALGQIIVESYLDARESR